PAERELDVAIVAAQNRYSEIRERLDAALATDAATARLAEEGQTRARLLGVIEEYLRNATAASAAGLVELDDRVRTLSEELAAVEPGTTGRASMKSSTLG